MRKTNLLHSPIFVACCLVAGGAHAQISFSGDTIPTGDYGGRQDINQHITVGDLEEGNLVISSGAVLRHNYRSIIAELAGSTGTVTVSADSQWNTGEMWIGRHGNATVNILSGGRLISEHAYIGQLAGGNAIATVDGPGSSWITNPQGTGSFAIGIQGATGTLRIRNGGSVITHNSLQTARDSASSGNIEIDGANSFLRVSRQCALGTEGPTSVKITNGGVLQCGQNNYLHSGIASLSGAGSIWSVGSDLDIGNRALESRGSRPERGQQAVLDIGEGSTVELAGNLRLAVDSYGSWGGGGTLNIGGSTSPGVLKAENVIFGNYGVSTINFSHSNTSGSYRFASNISGQGAINVVGTGTTVLTGNNKFAGYTGVQSGVLRAGSATGLNNGDYAISRAGTLDTNSYDYTLGTIRNAGTVTMGAGDTKTVITSAQYYGYGGVIHMNAALAGNNSATQKLVVPVSTSGTTTLNIRNLGGAGAQTTGNGILVVQVGGSSNGQFSLPAPAISKPAPTAIP